MAPRLGIRSATTFSSMGLLIITAVSVLVLVGVVTALQRSMELVSRDTRSAALAGDIEVAVLMYQRLSNLLRVTAEPEIAEARSEVAERIEQLLVQLPLYQGVGEEQRLIGELSLAMSNYLQRRDELDATGIDLEEMVHLSSVPLDELLEILDSLREVNDLQVSTATTRALQANRLSIYFALGALTLLIAGSVVLSAGVQRYLLRPIVALRQAMEDFRQGDMSARGDDSQGALEICDLARMFNDMGSTLEQQRRAQIEFLGGVAHDLKNPLSTLKSGIYLLALEPSEPQRARMRIMLDSQIELLVRMVDDFLDSARIEAGELELRCMEFDARHLTTELVQAYAALVPRRKLVLDEPMDAPVRLNADPMRIEQVLRNLIGNAIKYSTEGDIVVRLTTEDEHVVLEVVDHGIGIPESEQSRIFLPFKRRELNAAPGVGLGLSVVRRIVQAHGGTIEVESQEGLGSTFRVRLPRGSP